MRPIIPEKGSAVAHGSRARLVVIRAVLTLAIWYALFRGAEKFLGERHIAVYFLLFMLFPLVVILGVWVTRAIMASILNPDI